MTIKKDLKQEIDQSDGNCLDLVLRLLQQSLHQQQSKHDLLNCSRPVNYADAETGDGLAFTGIENATVFGKQLRKFAWQRNYYL